MDGSEVDLPSSVRPVSVGIVRVGRRYFGLVGRPKPSVHDPEKYFKNPLLVINKVQLLKNSNNNKKYLRWLQLRLVASIKVAFATYIKETKKCY